jgi:FkbM family methyltransferase
MTRARARVAQSLRALAGRPRLLPLTALLLRARTVRPALAFVARAGARRHGTFVYRLRENGLRVAIRHGTGDVVTLGEVFHEHDYRPPAEVEQRLTRVGRIVDLGANVGLFGAFAAARWPQAEILAFEPDPANAEVHARTIALNGLQARWTLVRSAAGASSGRARFLAGGVALSRLAGEGDEGDIEVELRDVLPELAGADLVKMDIEGGEWAILCDPRFRARPPRALVLEYHPRFCAGGDPREAAESALAGAGLALRSIWHRPDGHGMVWAWRS